MGILISVDTISDGFDKIRFKPMENSESYFDTFQRISSKTLSKLILKLQDLGFPVYYIVYGSFFTWTLDVAKNFGIFGAAFFSQSCVVGNIYYHVYKGLLKLPLLENEKIRIPRLLPLSSSNFSSFATDHLNHVHNFFSCW